MFRLLFLSIFVIFTLIIYFVFLKNLNIKRKYKIIIILLLIINFFTRRITRWFYNTDNSIISVIVAYISNLWIGFILIILFSCIIYIPIKFLLYLFSQNFYKKYNNKLNLVWLIICFLLLLYGIFEANNIKLTQINLTSNKINNNINNLKIFQISDLHLGRLYNKYKFDSIIKLIQTNKPDIIVFTGDFIENSIYNKTYFETELKKIKPESGKYFVSGNHDDHFHKKKINKFLTNCGIINLDDTYTIIKNNLVIAGIADTGWRRNKNPKKELQLLNSIDKSKYIIFLKHQPRVFPETIKKFDLMLSGHTHNGQIFPANYLVKLFYKYIYGLYQLQDNCYLYVSNGVGTWGPPIRILNQPELVQIQIKGTLSYPKFLFKRD